MRKTYLAILMGAMVALSACSSGDTAETTAAQTQAESETGSEASAETESETEKEAASDAQGEEEGLSTADMEHSGFVFQYGDTLIGMNEDSAPALAELGEWANYAETTSCAFPGLDKTYSYAGFDLYTYPLNDKDNVNSIYFTDDSVSTMEGIHIGSTQEEMEAAYGTDYVEEFGVYTYTKDDSNLQFIVTDGVVDSVEYTAIVPEA